MDLDMKGKLMGHTLTTTGVSNNINLHEILKLDIGYKEFGQIRISPNYLD
jgi:hypothetical protein